MRAFTFGHVRQLDALLGEALVGAWRAGAGPGEARLVIDVDSFVGEVCGRLKQGASYGYTKLQGYHPLLATRSDTPEVLHIRLRTGSANTQKGMLRFTEELIARVNRAGATGVKLLRADSGFWNTKVFARLEQADWQYSIGVRMHKAIRKAVEAIDENAWQPIEDYPEEREAQIAETTHGGRRLIVRRTRLVGSQAQLWPDWRHFAFLTNRTQDITQVESEHRGHAVVEQVIADLKDQALVHFPSGQFNANGAWTVLAALAHNLLRWTQLIGLPDSTGGCPTRRGTLVTAVPLSWLHSECRGVLLGSRVDDTLMATGEVAFDRYREAGEAAVALDLAESGLGFEHPGGGPSEAHLAGGPVFDVAVDDTDGGDH